MLLQVIFKHNQRKSAVILILLKVGKWADGEMGG